MKLHTGMTVREAGREAAEKIIQETARAYFHANPWAQYNRAFPMTVVGVQGTEHPLGPFMCTNGFGPEEACKDANYYGVCRSYTADVIWDAFHFPVPGYDCTYVGINMDKHPECIAYLFGGLYFKGEFRDINAPYAYTSTDKQEFLKVLRKGLRPGDLISATPAASTGNSGHIILFLGDVFGNGTDYITHCWPIGGGDIDLKTGINKREPYGAAVFQTADEFLFTQGSSPNWYLGAETMVSILVYRVANSEEFLDHPISDAGITRYNCPGLIVRKDCSVGTYQTALPGETVTVTEEFVNKSSEDYTLEVREPIPEGTSFLTTKGAERIVKNEIVWQVKVPAGDRAEISYQVEVKAEPGTLIEFRGGRADTLPTRPLRFRVGASKFNAAELAKFEKIRTEIPAELKPETYEGPAYVRRFYEALGREIVFPAAFNEYLSARFEVSKHHPDYPEVLIPKRELGDDGRKFEKLEVPRFIYGFRFLVPGDESGNRERAFETMECFFEPGDVMLSMWGANELSCTEDSESAVYIYLGGGKVLAHTAEGTALASFDDTFAAGPIRNFSVVLRPRYLA
ncbi:MAG: DUF11 domain-containing protein [Lachnospiraceae bacterium]|nr:DUF11 domain-containing protein [Lachnospiraceae bacterium]